MFITINKPYEELMPGYNIVVLMEIRLIDCTIVFINMYVCIYV